MRSIRSTCFLEMATECLLQLGVIRRLRHLREALDDLLFRAVEIFQLFHVQVFQGFHIHDYAPLYQCD